MAMRQNLRDIQAVINPSIVTLSAPQPSGNDVDISPDIERNPLEFAHYRVHMKAVLTKLQKLAGLLFTFAIVVNYNGAEK